MPCDEANGLLPGRGIPEAAGLGAGGAGGVSGVGAGASGAEASGAGFGAGLAVGFGSGFSSTGTGTMPSSANAALSFRTTGGSTVDEGPLTNSPISFSFSKVRFESIPNSAAISCTRAFAATILLSGRTQPGRASTYKRGSFRATHEDSISHSALS